MAGFGGLEIYSLMDREPVEIGKDLRCGTERGERVTVA